MVRAVVFGQTYNSNTCNLFFKRPLGSPNSAVPRTTFTLDMFLYASERSERADLLVVLTRVSMIPEFWEEVRHEYYDVIDSFDNVWRSGKAVFVELNQHRPWFVPIFACYSVGF